MATILFSTLIDGDTVPMPPLPPFDPIFDILQFDVTAISASAIQLNYAVDGTGVSFTAQGRTVFLPPGVLVSSLTTTNITFANGSVLVVGDNNVLTANDALANTLIGTIQGDYLTGLGGADTMQGGQGDDTYVVADPGDVVNETPFINSDIRPASSTTDLDILGSGFSQGASLSADGNQVLFTSNATNFVLPDDPLSPIFPDHIFIKNLQTGAIQLVSSDANGVQGNGLSSNASFSADGSRVVFESDADNLVADDTNGSSDIFVKYLTGVLTGEIQRISTDANSVQSVSGSANASFSADGSRVVFVSDAADLVAGDTNGNSDIFVKDLTGAIQRVSTDAAGVEGDGFSTNASFSADGRYVVFESDATNLLAANPVAEVDDNFSTDIFIKDLQTGAVRRVSTNTGGVEGNFASANASFSTDGRSVVFDSFADNLVGNDTNGTSEIFIKDLQTGDIRRASTNASITPGSGSSTNASLSADGRYVVFESTDNNLVAELDNNFSSDIFVKDLKTNAIRRVSTDNIGTQSINDDSTGATDATSKNASFSADGRYVVFESVATNLVAGDTKGNSDVFRVLNPFGGVDAVLSSVNYTLGDNLENLTLTGVANINGTGNTVANIIIGNSGANLIDGGAGADTMLGGAGNDDYVVDSTLDEVTELANEGTDRVSSSISYALGATLENLTLTGVGAINGTGNEAPNTIIGNSGNNILNGGAGDDILTGGAGNDTADYRNSTDGVTVSLLAVGSQLVSAGSGSDTLSGIENLVGSGFNDLLTGDAGDNILSGLAGNDTMTGDAGDDEYIVDNTQDVAFELAGGGTDRVWSSANYALGAEVEKLQLTGTAAINGAGNTQNNVLVGNSGANILNGWTGTDTMVGGTGNDEYIVDDTQDLAIELAGGGTEDRVWSSANYTLGANVETLQLTGTAAINGTGNTLANTIVGNSGANTLTGGAGNDLFIFNTTPDALNVDTITDFVSGQDRMALSANFFAGLGIIGEPVDPGVLGVLGDVGVKLIYTADTGLLAYDADGAGAGAAAVDIAIIGTQPATLAAADFLIIA